MKKIVFCVTNDLVHDRRMDRICRTLSSHDFDVTLVGRCYINSPVLPPTIPYHTARMAHWFRSGIFFYIEYQIRLFRYLLSHQKDAICCVDLDTIIPAFIVARMQRLPVVYDAHEYFTEVPELKGRALVKRVWSLIGKWCVPKMDRCYTVGEELAIALQAEYGKPFDVIRNMPFVDLTIHERKSPIAKVVWYHGALNVGRGLPEMILAMHLLKDCSLCIAGDGDISDDLRALVKKEKLEDRITFLGWVSPDALMDRMKEAAVGINLLDRNSISYYWSAANKAYDYIQAGLPAVHMDFPGYVALDEKGPIGALISSLDIHEIATAIQRLMQPDCWQSVHHRLLEIRHQFSWENEAEKLVEIYQNCFNSKLVE